MKKVLIAYSSKHGATEEIAEKIGAILKDAGVDNIVEPVGNIPSIEGYRAVIIGSGVYIGSWRKEARKFLIKHTKELASMPLWVFSSGPTGEGDTQKLTKGWLYPKNLEKVMNKLNPVGIVLFHGALDKDKMGTFEKWLISNVDAPIGDFREWDEITLWAKSIAEKLKIKDK